jgi:lysophospholipase L1-like esterase
VPGCTLPHIWRRPLGCGALATLLLLSTFAPAASFFSNPARLANFSPTLWDTAPIGIVWSDDFNRASLGTNWTILGSAAATIVANEIQLSETNTAYSRQVYYQPWLTCSDHWTLRWTQRFSALDSSSLGVGVGLKNFQAAGGDDVGYNALLSGAGSSLGKMQIEKYTGTSQTNLSSGTAMTLSARDILDCSLTRSLWTLTATASNRANSQVSTSVFSFTLADAFATPPISRICLYPLRGTLFLDNISFALDRRQPAHFIVIGGSTSEGYRASTPSKGYVSLLQTNYLEAVCNDSGSWNTVTNSVSVLPEILAHRPAVAIVMIAGNDLAFHYPASQWQSGYSNLVFQLQASGARVKHCFPTPRNNVNLLPLKNWISTNFPAKDVIDTWTPFLTGTSSLKPAYDGGDGVHPNDAGHFLLSSIIRTNLP